MGRSLSLNERSWPVSSGVTYLILFVIWPLLAFISALANYNSKEARRTVYIFLVYYGLTFVAEWQYMDAIRYIEVFKFNATLPFSEFFNIIGGLFSTDSSIDIIEPLISFTVSRFTESHHFLFAAYALLFAFFYLKSFNLLYDRYQKSPDQNALVFLVFFALLIPATAISVPRMWTAAWIFFYGAYHVIVYRKTQYLFLALAAGLMHWSFFAVNLVLIIYYFVGNRNVIYTPITIASFILPNALLPLFTSISPMLGAAVESRFEGYTSETYAIIVEDLTSQASWFVLLNNRLIFYYFVLMIVFIRFARRDHVRGKVEENWYSFLLVLAAFVNFGRSIPEFGSRMQTVFILFSTVYVFFYYMNYSWGKLKLLTLAGMFPMALFAFIEFRVGAETINPWILAPGLGLPLLDPTLSLAELLFR